MRPARALRKAARAIFGEDAAAARAEFGAVDAVRAIYLAGTGVAPSEEQLAAGLAEVGNDPVALSTFAVNVRHTAAVAARTIKDTLADHSEAGEFGMLLRELVTAGRAHGIIVDVGANGRMGSNSYDLLTDYGWRGLLIEANPGLHDRIRQEFGDADYTLLSCAIGMVPGRQTLHFGIDDQISSLDPAKVETWGDRVGGVEVDVHRLPDVLSDYDIPHDFDVLNLDIEGLDVAVLNDLIATSPYRPRWILAEAPMTSLPLEDTGLSPLVLTLYELADRTLANVILRRR